MLIMYRRSRGVSASLLFLSHDIRARKELVHITHGTMQFNNSEPLNLHPAASLRGRSLLECGVKPAISPYPAAIIFLYSTGASWLGVRRGIVGAHNGGDWSHYSILFAFTAPFTRLNRRHCGKRTAPSSSTRPESNRR
jgi:hypothetical protein